MKVTILPATPPPGIHQMRLVGRDEVVGKYQTPAIKWTFQVHGGQHDGKQATKTTGFEARSGESLCEFLAELLGQDLQAGGTVDLDDFVGDLFDVVLATRNGSSAGVVIRKVSPVAGE